MTHYSIVIASYLDGLVEVPLPSECYVREIDLKKWHKKLDSILKMNEAQLNNLRHKIINKIKYHHSDLEGFMRFSQKIAEKH